MNIQDIYQLMNHFEGSGISELELEMEGVKVGLKKGGHMVSVFETETMSQSTKTKEVKPTEVAVKVSGTKVEAPLLGTLPCDEEIESIQVENGQMVEYHQVLMTVK